MVPRPGACTFARQAARRLRRASVGRPWRTAPAACDWRTRSPRAARERLLSGEHPKTSCAFDESTSIGLEVTLRGRPRGPRRCIDGGGRVEPCRGGHPVASCHVVEGTPGDGQAYEGCRVISANVRMRRQTSWAANGGGLVCVEGCAIVVEKYVRRRGRQERCARLRQVALEFGRS